MSRKTSTLPSQQLFTLNYGVLIPFCTVLTKDQIIIFKSTDDLLLFVDEIVLVTNSVNKNCQEFCKQTDSSLPWSKIEPTVVKCHSLAYHRRPISEFSNLCLHIPDEEIRLVIKAFKKHSFLGLPIGL